MLKSNLVHLPAALVLTLGLASCARDQHHSSGGAATGGPLKIPRIVRQEGLIDLPAWDKNPDKRLSLHDTIDLSDARPRAAEVTAHCGTGAREVVHHSWFERPRAIAIYQTLPEALLTRDLSASPESCRYEVTLSSDAGQRHGFLLTAVIHDDEKSPVRLETPAQTPTRRLDVAKLSGIRLRYDEGRGKTQARLVCADLAVPALPFAQVLDVGSFDFGAVAKAEVFNAVTMSTNPVQRCRFTIEAPAEGGRAAESAGRVAVSNLLTVQFSHGIWWLEPVTMPAQSGPLNQGGTIALADYRIHNLDDKPHVLRSTKDAFGARVHIHYPNPQYASEVDAPWVGIEVVDNTGPRRLHAEALRVEPNQAVRLRVQFFNQSIVRCYYSGLKVTATEPIFLEDVGAHGEIRASIEVPVTKPGVLVVNPEMSTPLPDKPDLIPAADNINENFAGRCSF